MKKFLSGIFYAIILLIGCTTTKPAVTTEPAVKESRIIEKVTIIESTKIQKELFLAAKMGIAETYSDAKAIIDYEDKDTGIILLKGAETFTNFISLKFEYWAKIEVRDYKMRITFNNFKGTAWYEGRWIESFFAGKKYIDTYEDSFYQQYTSVIETITRSMEKAAKIENSSW